MYTSFGVSVALIASLIVLLLIYKSVAYIGNNNYAKYFSLIRIHRITSIKMISEKTGTPVEKVQKEIQKMIDTKYITGVHLNSDKSEIIFNDEYTSDTNKARVRASNHFDAIICKNCGATNPITNERCEFCGSPLNPN